jgi:hypothetical protein
VRDVSCDFKNARDSTMFNNRDVGGLEPDESAIFSKPFFPPETNIIIMTRILSTQKNPMMLPYQIYPGIAEESGEYLVACEDLTIATKPDPSERLVNGSP